MRKHVFGRQLKRDANERKALFKGLMNSLVMNEKLETTEAKAKAIRGKVEKLITKAKNRKEEARAFLQPYFSAEAIEKVLTDLAPRFANRPGGYTRLIKLGARFSDNASMAMMEWVEKSAKVAVVPSNVKKEATEKMEATTSVKKTKVEKEIEKKAVKPKAKSVAKKETEKKKPAKKK
ncbi:MAG: 50S ribosomal protein L17 [Candidatus Levyibacteriota bacterium]